MRPAIPTAAAPSRHRPSPPPRWLRVCARTRRSPPRSARRWISSTINAASFKVGAGAAATPVTGAVTYDAAKKAATFTPSPDFAANTAFTATITKSVKSQAGAALAADLVWNFATSLCQCQTPVALGSASGFAVLAGSTVTSTNATTVTGDLGVSPGTAVTGFPPGTLNGSQFTGVGSSAGPAAASTDDRLQRRRGTHAAWSPSREISAG